MRKGVHVAAGLLQAIGVKALPTRPMRLLLGCQIYWVPLCTADTEPLMFRDPPLCDSCDDCVSCDMLCRTAKHTPETVKARGPCGCRRRPHTQAAGGRRSLHRIKGGFRAPQQAVPLHAHHLSRHLLGRVELGQGAPRGLRADEAAGAVGHTRRPAFLACGGRRT